jgi:hypothetical protein
MKTAMRASSTGLPTFPGKLCHERQFEQLKLARRSCSSSGLNQQDVSDVKNVIDRATR